MNEKFTEKYKWQIEKKKLNSYRTYQRPNTILRDLHIWVSYQLYKVNTFYEYPTFTDEDN